MGTLTIADTLFHQIEERARASGKTVEAETAELLAKALIDDLREAELLAEIRKERDEMAAQGIFLTDESIAESQELGTGMIVVDTHLVAYTVLHGAATPDAERVRARDRDWVAPSLLRFELMNVIARECKGNRLTRDGALRSMRRGLNLVSLSKLTSDPLFIFNTALATGCSTCDLEFVWLAMELGVPLVTNGKQILRAFPTIAVDLRTFA